MEEVMIHACCILVVDDDDDTRASLRDVLVEEKCQVLEARDGAEALQVARKTRPDLVLLDLSMPGVSGWETLKRLRADARLKELPVAIVTGSPPQDVPTGIHVIRKPFGLQAVLDLLAMVDDPLSASPTATTVV